MTQEHEDDDVVKALRELRAEIAQHQDGRGWRRALVGGALGLIVPAVLLVSMMAVGQWRIGATDEATQQLRDELGSIQNEMRSLRESLITLSADLKALQTQRGDLITRGDVERVVEDASPWVTDRPGLVGRLTDLESRHRDHDSRLRVLETEAELERRIRQRQPPG